MKRNRIAAISLIGAYLGVTPWTVAQDQVAALSPRIMTYQGLVQNIAGPIHNQTLKLQFSAWTAAEGGSMRGSLVEKTLLASEVQRGIFSVELDTDALGLPDDAGETFLQIAVCSPAPCQAEVLNSRVRVSHAPLSVSSRSLGGAAYADESGALLVESAGADSGVLRLKNTDGDETMMLRAGDRTLAMTPSSGTSSLKIQANSANGDATEALLDDALGLMTLSKLTATAEGVTAAASARSLEFSLSTGEITALRTDTATAPLALSSRSSSGDKTQIHLDDSAALMTVSKFSAAAGTTAAAASTKRLEFNMETGLIAASRTDIASAPLSLASKSASGNKTLMLLDDAASQISMVKEFAPLATAGSSPPPRMVTFDFGGSSSETAAIANTVTISAFEGTNASTLRFKAGDTLAMEMNADTQDVTIIGNGALKATKVHIGDPSAITAGGNPVVELVTGADVSNVAGAAASRLEMKVDGNVVDRWTGMGSSVVYGQAANRISGALSNAVEAGKIGCGILSGGSDLVPQWRNRAQDHFGTIAGGIGNTTGLLGTVGGGQENSASGPGSVVAGGQSNSATIEWATVGGGVNNGASGLFATVSGGSGNFATAEASTAIGGIQNSADGSYSTATGGWGNKAGGRLSFAAGYRARVRDAAEAGVPDGDKGTFVWSDASTPPILWGLTSDGPNKFLVRASGGTTFYSNSDLTAGVTLAAGGGSWSSVSDHNLKENVAEVDKTGLLDRLASVPISTWNYKSQDNSIRHIGPMAQDFHAAFNVGEENTKITTIDADGVALAAIQGLYEIVQQKDCEVEALREENSELRARLETLEALIAPLVSKQELGAR